jgi:hypothetical protein
MAGAFCSGADVNRLARANFWQVSNPEQNELPVSEHGAGLALTSNSALTKNAKRSHRRSDRNLSDKLTVRTKGRKRPGGKDVDQFYDPKSS